MTHNRTNNKDCPLNKKTSSIVDTNNKQVEPIKITNNILLCKCGSDQHSRTNHSSCILNIKNKKNLEPGFINSLLNAHKERLLKIAATNRMLNINKKNLDFFKIAKKNNIFSPTDIFGTNVILDLTSKYYARHKLPPRDQICPFCNALLWLKERNKGTKSKPEYSLCCARGKVVLAAPENLPLYLEQMLEDKHFMSKIRFYNAAFSFISFKADSDANLSKNNVYTYRIHGMIHHRIGPLIQSNKNFSEKCAQIYIYDGQHQEDLRKNYSPDLNLIVLKNIRIMLEVDCQNPFISKFKLASLKIKENPSLDLIINIITDKNVDKRTYNKPTSNEIAVLIPSLCESSEPTNREGLVFEKNGVVKKINANLASYDPLQYVLMFPYGQQGWEPNLYKLNLKNKKEETNQNINNLDLEENNLDEQALRDQQTTQIIEEDPNDNILNEDTNKKVMQFVSAMQYYAYQLCDRSNSYIHRFGRLFHQYVVDQYSKIELNRLNFLRNNQETIRADLYQNIKNADSDQLGYKIGKRIVLPSTYNGSPRNLQQLFQDSMAVIRAHGKPDLFITVTCNPHWPEIEQEMKNVSNPDKITIIARVFKLKLQAILDDIYKNKIFGNVKAKMYVIEFQKRGRSHVLI